MTTKEIIDLIDEATNFYNMIHGNDAQRLAAKKAYEERMKGTNSKAVSRDAYRFKNAAELADKNTESSLAYERHSKKRSNLEVVDKALDAYDASKDATNEKEKAKLQTPFKKMVTSFYHSNVDNYKDPTDTDVKAFRDLVRDNKVDSSASGRFGYMMKATFANKTYKQGVEEKHITDITNNLLKKTADKNSKEIESGKMDYAGRTEESDTAKVYTVISGQNFINLNERLKKAGQQPLPPQKSGNCIVPQKLCKEYKIPELTKASDFWISDALNGKIFITFKSTEKQGGSQGSQVNDVIHTLNAFKSNTDFNKTQNASEKNRAPVSRSIAVVRGGRFAELRKDLSGQPDPKGGTYPNGTYSIRDNVYRPIKFAMPNSNRNYIYLPRLMTEGEWATFLRKLGYLLTKKA